MAILEEEGLAPSDLWLDVTAPCLADSVVPMALVEQLRGEGVRLFLDDFGSGDAPLAPLARCPLDCVKLDPALVRGLLDADEPPLLAAALAATRSLGLPVLAEGVETEAQRDKLLRLGCALGQGSFFSSPLPADEAMTLIVDRSSGSGGGRRAARPAGAARGDRRPRKKLEPARSR